MSALGTGSKSLFSVEKDTEVASMLPDDEGLVSKIDPRVRKVYNGVKVVLRSYRTGKLPKAFKVSFL